MLLGTVASTGSRYENTIPPEILSQYAKGIVDGSRPKFVTITKPMIWGLRNKPNQGGEIYRLDLNMGALTTVQTKILQDWVKEGQKVLIWGRDEFFRYANFFAGLGSAYDDFPHAPQVQLSNHPVNTDVHDIDFSDGDSGDNRDYAVFRHYPIDVDIIVSVSAGVIAGFVPFGRGGVYFASPWKAWGRGADRDRWTLNFNQWMLGLDVPGVAQIGVGVQVPTEEGTLPTKDAILLKNGDIISGTILTETITIRTSYAPLEFGLEEIENIQMEGAGQNIDIVILRNGDRLSGIVGPEQIKIKLDSGQEPFIDKDKIKEVSLGIR